MNLRRAGGRPAGNAVVRQGSVRPLGAAAIIGWTALSAVVPGAAHIRAGHRRTGIALICVYAFLLLAAGGTIVIGGLDLAGFALRDSTLVAITAGAVTAALLWFGLILWSYIVLDPDRLSSVAQIFSGIAVGILCVTVMTPFAVSARTVLAARDSLNTVFKPAAPNVAPIQEKDPWEGKERINFLLVGGDAHKSREGVRTDSMTLASVHIKSGNTVLFSLPRNLQYVRFPDYSPLQARFPNGFQGDVGSQGLLNEVWEYADNHPEIMGGPNKGADALKAAIHQTLGLKVDYYALVDMYGFAEMVDAIGGIVVKVERDVRYGGDYGTAGTIRAGTRRLSGEEALWYGRSRVGSDDFSRMGRQRCLLGALAKQADPVTVLRRFDRIAAAAKRLFRTDIPRPLLEHIVPVAQRVTKGRISSLQFVPPLIYTGNPDWAKIRAETNRALRESLAPPSNPVAVGTPKPGSTATTRPGRPNAGKTPTPTPTRDKQAKTLDELC
ncbi:LCP family protein [Rhizohabitans arisaemae]|uniref:LCP family protein n=1 Tax=Rhizohabitans arisaemae TaxID=2720610 RepID=UPI0024B10631|nr:LCP family protein [Rhizohabitans arisaemae]